MDTKQAKINRLKLNTLIDIEETKIRLDLQLQNTEHFKLGLLANFRPNASLRQINNQRKLNLI
jgi:hypothetical protein